MRHSNTRWCAAGSADCSAAEESVVIIVNPSRSRKLICWKRDAGGGVGWGKCRKTNVESWRVGVRVLRRWARESWPGAVLVGLGGVAGGDEEREGIAVVGWWCS